MIKMYFHFAGVFLILFAGCKKEEVIINPPMPEVPYIEIRSASPGTVTAFEDSIVFILYYEDGNGDLGYNSPDSLSLFVTDTRIPLTESFFVPLLAPEGAEIAIQGELAVTLNNTILVDPEALSEIVNFEIQLRDRSGNLSNVVVTQDIVVLHQ